MELGRNATSKSDRRRLCSACPESAHSRSVLASCGERCCERSICISHYIKDRTGLLEKLKTIPNNARHRRARLRSLSCPVPTRWYLLRTCLQNLLDNRGVVEKVHIGSDYAEFEQQDRANNELRKAITMDTNFWGNLYLAVRMINPIIKELGALESVGAFVSCVYPWSQWLKTNKAYCVQTGFDVNESSQGRSSSHRVNICGIPSSFSHDLEDPSTTFECDAVEPIEVEELPKYVRAKVASRWDHVHTNAMGIAYFLDPRTDQDTFADEDEMNNLLEACNFATKARLLKALDDQSNIVRELYNVAAVKRTGGEESRTLNSKIDPRTFWTSRRLKYPLTARLADTVFAIPTSSVAGECARSIASDIHTTMRNRLSLEKVETLVYICINEDIAWRETLDLAWLHSYSETANFDE